MVQKIVEISCCSCGIFFFTLAVASTVFYVALDKPTQLNIAFEKSDKISITSAAKWKLPTGLNFMAHNQKEARMHLFVAASETLNFISNCYVCDTLQNTIYSCF